MLNKMQLFRKKCQYCGKKIDRGKEIFRDVRDPVFVGTRKKAFCCIEHAELYEKEINEYIKNSRNCKTGCCG